MKQPKKRISITLDADSLEKLRVLAEEDERSLSQYINKVVKAHVSVKEWKSGAESFRL